jgi:autotransporter translocation and assembly factor TamB
MVTALPTSATAGADLGQASMRLTYADGAARANLTFASARGGSLRADANATADLGYPQVLQGPPLSKLPMRGQVVARDLDVAWVAQFNPRVESLGGRVSANARLTGTMADPRFVGDVRWKDGGGVLSRVSAANLP